MCGIIGYVGEKTKIDIVLGSLKRLEYRGYDSAGIAINNNGNIVIEKSKGTISNLENQIASKNYYIMCALGHTRWATHGEANEINAHPHISDNHKVALVHNGIVENYNELKVKYNIITKTATDTEIIAQLLGMRITNNMDERTVLEVINNVCLEVRGTYAFGIVVSHIPEKIFFAKRNSPLIIGCGTNGNFIASDITAILPYTNDVIYVRNNDIGYISKDKIKIFNSKMQNKNYNIERINISSEQIMLGKYKTFMEKEIAQGSYSMINTLVHLIKDKNKYKNLMPILLKADNYHIVACGTALHAGMIGKYLLERECEINISLDFASEFRYKRPIVNKRSVCIFISQSGETADTIASLQLAKSKGAFCLAVTNVRSSRIAQLADFIIPTFAGPEIAVASTKAYIAQLTALYYIVELFAKVKEKKLLYRAKDIIRLASKIQDWSVVEDWAKVINKLSEQQSLYFIGRGIDYYLAMEGALKLKEISYIHCEAFAGGELKHGSLALLSEQTYVIVLLTQKSLIDKTLNTINEIKSRKSKVILITQFIHLKSYVDYVIELPSVKNILMPFIAIKPLQELALLCAEHKGLNPDKPRNLAKSVTVE